MQGWMLYRQKGGIVGRLAGLLEHRLYFILTESCQLLGFKDESHIDLENPDVTFNAQQCAIIFSQESTKQFEILGERNRDRITFMVDNASDVHHWVSCIQAQRSKYQGSTQSTKSKLSRNSTNDEKKRLPRPLDSDFDDYDKTSNHKNSAGQHKADEENPVFDDPLRSNHIPSSPNNGDDYEWENEMSPTLQTADAAKVAQLSKELEEAKVNISRYRDRITSYQEVLASRDRQLFEIQDQLVSTDPSAGISVSDTEAYKSVEEQLKSYREQNALLNEEVLKLHEMYNKSQNEYRQQHKKCGKLSTELQRYQRDFLLLLAKSVHRPLVEPDDNASLSIPERSRHISSLKNLSHTVKVSHDRILGCSVPSLGKHEHVDAFGFIRHLPNEPIQVQYLALHLKDAFDAVTDNNEDNPKNLKKWRTFIKDHSAQFEVTSQLQKLILNGVPTQYRAYIWQKMIHHYVADVKTAAGDGYFEDLLGHQDVMQASKEFSKTLKQISMDVPRTMPNNRDFMAEGSPLQERLSRVLIAFCIHCSKIGYCQGFNFLAGGCLLFLEEEDAFWFLIAVTEKLFPAHYYHNGLSGLLADQYMLQDILAQVVPRLSQHLAKFSEVDLAAVTTGWFLGLFFDSLPFQTVIRVWDCFLAFGHEAMFRVACGVIKQFEEELLEINEPSQLLHAIKNIPKLCFHKQQLITDSFSLANFPSMEDIDEQRRFIESDLIDKHEEKVRQRKEFDERMVLFDESNPDDFSWSFSCGVEVPGSCSGRVLLCANCSLAQNSQLFEVDFTEQSIGKASISVASRVICMRYVTDDVVLLGLFSRKLEAYSVDDSSLCWSMSLSDIVLCFIQLENVLFVGTCDGKLHILQSDEFRTKPVHKDSIELSKRPTTALCWIPQDNSLWVASGPAIYVINTETYETDGFFLISTKMVQVCHLAVWRHTADGRDMVWMTTRDSAVLQLRSASVDSGPPVLMYDTSKEKVLPCDLSMMPDSGGDGTSTGRIVSLQVWEKDRLWVGTACGKIKVYQMMDKEGGDGIELCILFHKQPNSRMPKCFVKTSTSQEHLLLACSGGYEDSDSLSWWTEDGFQKDFSLEEDPVPNMSSRSVSLPVLQASSGMRMSDIASKEEDANLASSSESSLRSSDSDARPRRSGGPAVMPDAGTEAWKSAMKNAAASAMRTYRDKKPAMKKFMNMLGGNQS